MQPRPGTPCCYSATLHQEHHHRGPTGYRLTLHSIPCIPDMTSHRCDHHRHHPQDDILNSTHRTYMPALNRLLGDGGTRFSNTLVSTSVCCPARVSLLTGRLPHCTNVTANWFPAGEGGGGCMGPGVGARGARREGRGRGCKRAGVGEACGVAFG